MSRPPSRRERAAVSILERHAESWRAHLRLTILRFLADMQHATASATDSLLASAVVDVGIDADRDQVVAAIEFLARAKCLKIERVPPVLIASLTDLGEKVARGTRRIEGVQPPSRR